jgi:hypothetical protein
VDEKLSISEVWAKVAELRAFLDSARRTLTWSAWASDHYALTLEGFPSDSIADIYHVDGLEWHWITAYDHGYCPTLLEAMNAAEEALPATTLRRSIDVIIRPKGV